MKKNISVLIDTENVSTYTNFDKKDVNENDLVLTIMHLSSMLKHMDIDLIDVFNGIVDILEEMDDERCNEYLS